MRNWPTAFDLSGLKSRAAELDAKRQEPNFWQDQAQAQEISRELAEVQTGVAGLETLRQKITDATELYKLAHTEGDSDTLQSLASELPAIDQVLKDRERELRFSGIHDRADAILLIQSGAGGTDAQDWAEMLERMYLRFAEKRGWPTHLVERMPGEEAGIKHATYEIKGRYAFGILKAEAGVHRLVRLSPFNADHLRQTSFARVEVIPSLPEKELPAIDPKDLEFDTFRASGAGGQHVNKTSSAVRVHHLPTGIIVECQNERSQAQNKAQALSVLKAKLLALLEVQRAKEVSDLRGVVREAAWGNQIRSYVLHPYKLVKDHRTKIETAQVEQVLDGDLGTFIDADFEAQ